MTINEQDYFKLMPNESLSSFWERIYDYKDEYDLTWFDIAKKITAYTDREYNSEQCRKQCAYWRAKSANDIIIPEFLGKERAEALHESTTEVNELFEQQLALKKLKVQISDERNQTNAYIRQLSREETLKDIAKAYAETMELRKPLPLDFMPHTIDFGDEAILLISDWHFGIEINNSWNVYNPEVARERIDNLIDKVGNLCYNRGVHKLHIVNLGDLISGRIHMQLRVSNREDIIQQTMDVAEILDNMICTFVSSYKLSVAYYDCLDNHSRVEPNKKESLDLESMVRIIKWYLKSRYKDVDNSVVEIVDNEFAEDIISFNCMGHKIGGVHGDKDSVSKVISNLTLLTKEPFELIVSAHIHHFTCDEQNGCILIVNPSLMGADDYALSLRCNSKSAQTLIFPSKDNVCECIYKLDLA